MRILIVDDMPMRAAQVVRLLAMRLPGATLAVAPGAEEARRLLQSGDTVVFCARTLAPALRAARTDAEPAPEICDYLMASDTLRHPAIGHRAGGADWLTAREADVLRLLRAGLPNKLIARELGTSLPTVKTHLANIFRKLGVASRLEVVCRLSSALPERLAA